MKSVKKHSTKKKEKIAARRTEAKVARAKAVSNSYIAPATQLTYADEKAANRAPGIAKKEAHQARVALLASIAAPGTPALALPQTGIFLRQCPYARRRGGRNRAYHKSARGLQKAHMRELGNEAYGAQRTIERVFQDKVGMRWMDVQRALTAKKWSWRNIYQLAAHKGIGPDLVATAVEQKEAA